MSVRDAMLHVTISNDYYNDSYRASIPIPSAMEDAFEPIDICSDESLVLLLSTVKDNVHTESTARVVRNRREGYAAILAKHLTAEIMKAMEAKDTRNGYAKEPT